MFSLIPGRLACPETGRINKKLNNAQIHQHKDLMGRPLRAALVWGLPVALLFLASPLAAFWKTIIWTAATGWMALARRRPPRGRGGPHLPAGMDLGEIHGPEVTRAERTAGTAHSSPCTLLTERPVRPRMRRSTSSASGRVMARSLESFAGASA